MKIKFASFTSFNSDIDIYDYEKLDLFAFMLVRIIEKGSDKTFKEVLLSLDVTNDLLYLYQNSLYYLLDNNFLINRSNEEKIDKLIVNDISFSEFGKYCLQEKMICNLTESKNVNIFYNPVDDKLVSYNEEINDSNVVVYTDKVDFLNLINKYRKEIIARYDNNFVLSYHNKMANPFYFVKDVSVDKIEDIKKYLDENSLFIEDNKSIDLDKAEFLSSNIKYDICYGEENKLVNSDYYLVIDEERKFTVEGNKIYIENVLGDDFKYSFIGVVNDTCEGVDVCSITSNNSKYSLVKRNKIKNYKSDLKKYLDRNKKSFNNDKVLSSIISLL